MCIKSNNGWMINAAIICMVDKKKRETMSKPHKTWTVSLGCSLLGNLARRVESRYIYTGMTGQKTNQFNAMHITHVKKSDFLIKPCRLGQRSK